MGCGCQKREPARVIPYPAAMPTMRGPVLPPPVGMPPPNPLAVCMANRQSNVVAGENIEVNRTVNRCSGQNTYIVTGEVDKDWVESELAKKADKTYVNTELAKKADKTYVNTELAKKSDKTYVNTELAKKADKTYVNTELAKKADKTYVNTELAKKSDKTYVDTELAKKADKTYVNTALAKKADKTYVNAELAKKADITYVDGKVAPKADKSYVDAQLATKVDKVAGKELSTNDFTNAYKSKLDSIAEGAEVNVQSDWNVSDTSSDAYIKNKPENLVQDANYVHTDNNYTDEDKGKLTSITWLPEAELGEDTSLVTTGEKYTWNHKQDVIDYYLADASITDEGALIITKDDGTTVTFTGNENAAIDHIVTIDGELPIENKTVTIPLAMTDTPGELSNAGLVKGIYESFNDNGIIEHI